MFIKKLTVKNFRCFTDKTIENLRIPDGTSGSGLNILIGENGNGKTTILEALNLLTQSSYSSNNFLDAGDFKDIEQEMKVSYESSTEFKCKMPPLYKDCYYEANGIDFAAKARNSRTPGKLLSSPFQVSASFRNVNAHYKKANGQDSGNQIQDFCRLYSAENIMQNELNVFYFDKNRGRQITQGTYKTTFERICDDLNWRFTKALRNDPTKQQTIIDALTGDFFELAKNTAQAGVGSRLADEVADFFDNDKYKDLKLDIINYLSPFTTGLLALRRDASLAQILSKDLGSGVEIIIALLMLKSIAGASSGTVVYLIDEPEAHLHPKAQRELLKLLLEEAKTKQIFISTHSPYIFKDAVNSKAGLFIFKRDASDTVVITDARDGSFGHFPWSPSWGEVNLAGYDLPTVELHNELYGYIQEQTEKYTEPQLEAYFVSKSVAQPKQWTRLSHGNPQAPYPVTLLTYIRNKIHHPENTHNLEFTEAELRQSIEDMSALIEAGL